MAQVLVRLRKQFKNNFVFPTCACAPGFNNNNNNNDTDAKNNEFPSLPGLIADT